MKDHVDSDDSLQMVSRCHYYRNYRCCHYCLVVEAQGYYLQVDSLTAMGCYPVRIGCFQVVL
jgi:hypothetical protein